MVVLKECRSCIKTLWKSGVREVGDLHNATGFPLKTLYRWTKQLKETNDLKQRSRSGRPKRLTPIQHLRENLQVLGYKVCVSRSVPFLIPEAINRCIA
ncbi:6238_t:CDS:2 [Funneliformis geosporum]|nr:6238_t:CDS:2 [Funneliformis geosporum]